MMSNEHSPVYSFTRSFMLSLRHGRFPRWMISSPYGMDRFSLPGHALSAAAQIISSVSSNMSLTSA
jgi:hypothetical protein